MDKNEYMKKEIEGIKQRAVKEYTIHDILKVGYNLEPLKCIHCGYVGETTYNQYINDAFCGMCGKWQIDCARIF